MGETITITVSDEGGTVKPSPEGSVIVPAGPAVTLPSGETVIVTDPEGGAVTASGEVKKLFTVAFDARGGSDTVTQTVIEGGRASKPDDPVREGYTFGGWYADSACTTAWDFDAVVSGSMTLYAKWTAIPNGGDPSDDDDDDDVEPSRTPSGSRFCPGIGTLHRCGPGHLVCGSGALGGVGKDRFRL